MERQWPRLPIEGERGNNGDRTRWRDIVRKSRRAAGSSRPGRLEVTGLRPDGGFFLGVDGGGTKTVALIADEAGLIHGAGRAGDPSVSSSDTDAVVGFVGQAVNQALPAGADLSDLSCGVFGLAGTDWEEDIDIRRLALERWGIPKPVVVKNDVFLGWRAALVEESAGIVLAAGTGAMVGVVAPGQEWHYGCYARTGGGLKLSRRALDAVYRAEDGRGRETALTDRLLRHYGVETVDDMLRLDTVGELAVHGPFSIAPIVHEAASAGDDVAKDLVHEQAMDLAEYVVAAIRRFSIEDAVFPVVLSGGIFRSRSTALREVLTSEILAVAPGVRFVEPEFPPAVGALLYAYDALDIVSSGQVIENLRATCPPPALFDTRSPESRA